MAVRIRCDRQFAASALSELFLSVNWYSGMYPEELLRSMRGADTVYTAWDGGRLVGLCGVLSDGAMTAYVNYLLVHPAYQHKGIGGTLFRLIMRKYRGYRRVILLADKGKETFYGKYGFEEDEHSRPMARIRKES